jgi:hypothetical protein
MKVVSGNPDPKHVSTSFVERQNLSMRMSIRRFTRLTNAFSKKVQNHAAAVALWFMYYNFCRVHSTLRVTPAMDFVLASRAVQVHVSPQFRSWIQTDPLPSFSLTRSETRRAQSRCSCSPGRCFRRSLCACSPQVRAAGSAQPQLGKAACSHADRAATFPE